MVLSVDSAGLPENANPEHCFTLVCALEDLRSQLLSYGNFDLES